MLKYHTVGCIQESQPQFENQIMARVYVRRITRSTMYQKAPLCKPELTYGKLVLQHVGSALLKSSILIIRKSLISRINEVYVFLIKYCFLAILKNINFSYNHLICCNHACYCANMVSVTSASLYVTSASRYHPRYQSKSSMYIRGMTPRNFAELAEVVPILSYGLLILFILDTGKQDICQTMETQRKCHLMLYFIRFCAVG